MPERHDQSKLDCANEPFKGCATRLMAEANAPPQLTDALSQSERRPESTGVTSGDIAKETVGIVLGAAGGALAARGPLWAWGAAGAAALVANSIYNDSKEQNFGETSKEIARLGIASAFGLAAFGVTRGRLDARAEETVFAAAYKLESGAFKMLDEGLPNYRELLKTGATGVVRDVNSTVTSGIRIAADGTVETRVESMGAVRLFPDGGKLTMINGGSLLREASDGTRAWFSPNNNRMGVIAAENETVLSRQWRSIADQSNKNVFLPMESATSHAAKDLIFSRYAEPLSKVLPEESRHVGSGSFAFGLKGNDGYAYRVEIGSVTNRPQIPEMLQALETHRGPDNAWQVEKLEFASPVRFTGRHLDRLQEGAESHDFYARDARPENIGRTADGVVRYIDPGAVIPGVRKNGEIVPIDARDHNRPVSFVTD
jgi:hypothetical protein